MRKRNIMKKVMSLVLGGCIAIGAAGCGALVPPAGIDPVPDTPDIPEQPERVREERDLRVFPFGSSKPRTTPLSSPSLRRTARYVRKKNCPHSFISAATGSSPQGTAR